MDNLNHSAHVLSSLESEFENFEKSKEYSLEALSIYKTYGDSFYEALLTVGIGQDYYNLENYGDAKTYLLDGLEKARMIKSPVIEGMARVTTLGTGKLAYIPGIEICGKTGTSENSGEDHSVFFAFAPRENPKIAIAVYVENAGFGGDIAAPIASLMIEKYINGEISARKQYLEDRMLNLKLINPENDLLSQATPPPN